MHKFRYVFAGVDTKLCGVSAKLVVVPGCGVKLHGLYCARLNESPCDGACHITVTDKPDFDCIYVKHNEYLLYEFIIDGDAGLCKWDVFAIDKYYALRYI